MDSNLIKIDLLKYHPNTIPDLVSIWHQVLGRVWIPDTPLDQVMARFHKHLNDKTLPLTLVAFCDDKPVGMASLRDNDGIRPDLTPWLGSLVVHPDYQKQGIASKLINGIMQKAKQFSYSQLYLFAFDPSLHSYYSKFGWHTIGEDTYKGENVTVMEVKL